MYSKQKSDMKITGLLPAIISVIIFLVTLIIWGTTVAVYVLGIVMLIYAFFIFYAYFRTKNYGIMITAIYMTIFGLFLISAAPHMIAGRKIDLPLSAKILIVPTFFLFYYLVYLNFKRKLKWRGREILELAASNIDQTKGVHTQRPMPTDKVSFSKSQLEEFSDYFKKNLLGLTYEEKNRIVFMPLKYKNEFFALYDPKYNYQEKTWIAINYNGDVSVNISKEDYLDYKEDLAFDQLCHSLSDVLIDFINLYFQGEEVRIMDKMNDLKINVFT